MMKVNLVGILPLPAKGGLDHALGDREKLVPYDWGDATWQRS